MNSTKLITELQTRLANSRFFTLSLVIHAAVIFILGGIVLIRSQQPEPDFIPDAGSYLVDLQSQKTTEETPDRPQEPKLNVSAVRPAAPKFDATATITTTKPSTFHAMLDVRVDMPRIELTSIDVAMPSIVSAKGGELGQRFQRNGSGHITMGNGRGNGPKPTKDTEQAVLRGLAWLQKVQNPDGSWGERNRGAMTGLALLCFLGHGEYGQSPQFGLTVNLAIEWIITNGTASQSRLSMSREGWGSGNAGVYEHGIATYALGEYYAMTLLAGSPDERVVELFRGAVQHIIEGQGPDGGWMYSFNKTQSDTSVSGWQVQALKTAHLSKLKIPDVDTTLDRAMLNFQRVQTKRGGYGYRKAEDRWSLSGVGVLCELFWRGTRDADSRRSVEFIMEGLEANPVRYAHERADLYAWYYHTQAMLMFGGSPWTKWESLMSPELVKSQSTDGSWPVMANPAHGGLQKESSVTGAVYRTALCVLMLESYYRYLPANRE